MRIVVQAADECLDVTTDAGERVLDALDEAESPSLFSCRSANCGICLVRVRSGAALLVAATSSEIDTLRELDAAEDSRLLCQVRVSADVRDENAVAEFELLQPRLRG